MKSIFSVSMIVLLAFVLNTSASQAQFRHGGNWLGPALTLATDPIGFGVQFEHGINQNVGIGGIIRYWGKSYSSAGYDASWSIVMPQVQGAYHFMPGDQLDPYAGGRLGWAVYSFESDFVSASDDGGLFLTAYGGVRYFFSPKIAGNGQLEFRVAGDDYFGGSIQLTVGVDFTL